MTVETQAKQNISFLPVIALATVPLIMVLGNSMLIPILPQMQQEIGITKFQASLVITLFSVPAGIIIPLAGYLSDQFNRKVVIIPSLLLYGLGGVVAGLSAWLMVHPYWAILAGRVLQGIGAAGTAPIAMALVGDLWKGGARAKALGIIEAANGLGKVLSPILGVLIALLAWYAAFFAFPIICVISALIVFFLVKESKKKGPTIKLREYMNSVKKTFKTEYAWLLTAYFAGAVALFILFGVLFYLSQILEEKYRVEGLMRGFILSVPLLAMSISSFITGAKIKRRLLLMKKLIVTGLFMIGSPLIFAAFFSNPYVNLGLLIISGVGTGLVLPCLNTFITSSVGKDERGIITSFYGSVRFLGVAAGPPIFGALMDTPRIMFFIMAGLAILCGLLSFLLINPNKNKGSDNKGHQFSGIETKSKLQMRKKAR